MKIMTYLPALMSSTSTSRSHYRKEAEDRSFVQKLFHEDAASSSADVSQAQRHFLVRALAHHLEKEARNKGCGSLRYVLGFKFVVAT